MLLFALLFALATRPELEQARDAQNETALQRYASELSAAASGKPDDAGLHYRAAMAYSYLAEVGLEFRANEKARAAAQSGITLAERAVKVAPNVAEHHRILGTLCGQIIPANLIAGLRYGRCALDSISKAIELDPKSAHGMLSRGVGNFYLPPAFGGGTDRAIADMRKAIELNPSLAEAHLWLGIALRKAGRNADARSSLEKAVQLNPKRVWAKKQLDKTPAK